MKSLSRRLSLACIALVAASGLTASGAESGTLEAGPFRFFYKAPWKLKSEVRPMSKGGLTYVQDGDGTAPVDADFYHFGAGQGGSVDANVERWVNQFAEGDDRKHTRESLSFDGQKVTIVRVEGTFLSGPPMLPASAKKRVPGQKLLGAIFPSEEGAVFIKLTGGAKSVDAVEKAFLELVESPFK